jgi:hypothetical protein
MAVSGRAYRADGEDHDVGSGRKLTVAAMPDPAGHSEFRWHAQQKCGGFNPMITTPRDAA